MKDTKLPIAVWLGMLPDGMRENAIEENLKYPFGFSVVEVESLSHALYLAFPWISTKQGYEYWCDFYKELKSQNL